MGQIRLNGMEFFAYHGCFPEERQNGNHFLVDVTIEVDMEKPSKSDDLRDTLNYAEVYELVKQEMAVPSHLLEHVSARIMDKIADKFPHIEQVEVSVSKLNPPIGGKANSVKITQKKDQATLFLRLLKKNIIFVEK